MGDTGGALLGIFQGYNQEVPFGGTSGLPREFVPSYNAVVQPPLMNWSGNTTLSSANASTTPQEFFLGSQYSAGISDRHKIVTSRTAGRRSSIQTSGSDTNSPVTFLLPAAYGGVFRYSTKPPSRP